LLGITKVVVAVNKLDLVGYSRDVFDEIDSAYREFAAEVGLTDIVCIPMSALRGDNITEPSPHTPWYEGPSLLAHLETVPVGQWEDGPFRMPVQWVNRPGQDFRGFSGLIVGGRVRVGDRVRVVPSGRQSTVTRIVTMDEDLDEALAEQSVTLTLADEIDISRGDVLCAADSPAGSADQFEAHVVWMAEDEMLPGRSYLLKLGTRTVPVSLGRPKYRVDVNSLEHTAATTLALNEIGVCNLNLERPIAFDPYAENRDMGGFVLIDRLTNATVGAGMLHFALRRSQNVHWQALEVDQAARTELKGHRSCVVWFTGLSGAGKSSIANLVEKRLHALGVHTTTLDGDNVRHGLNKDLGFTEADRVENIRRVGEVAHLMVNAGLVVLVSFISPFRSERRMAREMVAEGEFCEVFVDTPLAVAEQRDVKGLYGKARRGELINFTGIDSPYEPPEQPELRIDTTATTPEQAAEDVVLKLRDLGVLP
jgi:bifunctional enzyme CysN/CysC